jgi:hypothetical protein
MDNNARAIQNFGRKVIELSRGCCGYCNYELREETLVCADLYLCDACGRVWQHGDRGLLCEIGRREVK